jgi:glucose/arabinose dehydrogenase
MRIGVWGWSGLVVLIVFALAARVMCRSESVSSAADADARTAASPKLSLSALAKGFKEPVDMQFVPGVPGLAVVLEKRGRARLLQLPASAAEGAAAAEPATPGADVLSLDVRSDSELGLLGLAFHPRYRDNGLFYLNDNPKDDKPMRTRISEWHLPLAAFGKEPAQLRRVLLEIEQPFANHDGGQIAFGPDGYLYIGMGDGGSRADPHKNGQNLNSLLGKMLRIDVNGQPGYAIPADNPFVGKPGVRPEIWAYGMRNPWRFSFDPKGRMIAADVGQDLFEEVDIVAAGDNQGWALREATHCFPPADTCETAGMIDPIFEYGRDAGNSITGGHVYLGLRLAWLRGKYLFADYVSGRVWALQLPEQRSTRAQGEMLGRFPHAFSAFARDEKGEVYALDFAGGLVLGLNG